MKTLNTQNKHYTTPPKKKHLLTAFSPATRSTTPDLPIHRILAFFGKSLRHVLASHRRTSQSIPRPHPPPTTNVCSAEFTWKASAAVVFARSFFFFFFRSPGIFAFAHVQALQQMNQKWLVETTLHDIQIRNVWNFVCVDMFVCFVENTEPTTNHTTNSKHRSSLSP